MPVRAPIALTLRHDVGLRMLASWRAMTNFVVKAGRSSLNIFPGHWPESESSLGVGTGINGYLDRLTEEAASVVRPEASPGGGGSYRLQGNAA